MVRFENGQPTTYYILGELLSSPSATYYSSLLLLDAHPVDLTGTLA